MRNIILLLIFLYSCSPVNKESYKNDIKEFQTELNKEFLDSIETPLRGKFFKNFSHHPFFPINQKYRVEAEYTRLTHVEPFQMPTSSGKTQTYLAYAKVNFSIDGENYSLKIYQNQRLKDMEEYEDHLFLPFYDETNDIETYAGGRYIDLNMPKKSKLIIDFNKAYQPYCAYNIYDYSCPIVPSENRLDIRIPAGGKYNAAEFEH